LRPLKQHSEASLYLLVFEEIDSLDAHETTQIAKNQQKINVLEEIADFEHASDVKIAALMQELRAKDEFLQAANEELESSNEELKSSGEEMQSVNEELHSTNEELETSKEELQSLNEELATVNTELQTKVADLSRVNNDMNNLLAGTGVAQYLLTIS